MEKVQDVQDRSVDNKVVVVSQEFKEQSDNKLEEVDEAKRGEMVTIDDKQRQKQEEEKRSYERKKRNNRLIKAPEEEEGKIIDLKG